MKLDCEFPCELLSLNPPQKHFKRKSELAALKFSDLCCFHEKLVPSALPSSPLSMAGELASNDESRQAAQLRKFLNSFWTFICYFTFLFNAYLFPLQRQLTKKKAWKTKIKPKILPPKRNQLVYCIDVLPGNLIVVAVSKNPAPWLMSYSPLNHAAFPD